MKRFIIACMALLTVAACTDELDHSGEVHATATELYSVTLNTAMFSAEIYGNGVTERGVCWAETELPTVENFKVTDSETGTGAFEAELTGLKPGTKYYVRAYAVSGADVMYSSQFDFSTYPEVTPKLDDKPLSTISKISLKANVNGGMPDWTISERGVCYSTTANPTIDGKKVKDVKAGLGDFEIVIPNLTENTTYYIRAYAVYDEGVAYSKQMEVKTKVIAEMKDFFFEALDAKELTYGLLYKSDNKFAMHYSLDQATEKVTITYIETSGLKDAKHVTKAYAFNDDFSEMTWEKVSYDGVDFSGLTVDTSTVAPIVTEGVKLVANMTSEEIRSIFTNTANGGIQKISKFRWTDPTYYHGSIPASAFDGTQWFEYDGNPQGIVVRTPAINDWLRGMNALDKDGKTDMPVVDDVIWFKFDKWNTGNAEQQRLATAHAKPVADIMYDTDGVIIFKADNNNKKPTDQDFTYYMVSKNKATWVKWDLEK